MIRIQIDRKKVSADLTAYFDALDSAAREELRKTAELIRDDMREEGKPVTYPVQWDSERQRRAFFATNGFGAGIPYTRTGKYNSGWAVAEFSAGYTISNSHPAGAIGGTISNSFDPFNSSNVAAGWQSKIHRGRWKEFAVTAAKHISELPKRLLDALIVVNK